MSSDEYERRRLIVRPIIAITIIIAYHNRGDYKLQQYVDSGARTYVYLRVKNEPKTGRWESGI